MRMWFQIPRVLCDHRRRGRGPLAAVPSPAARRAPAAAATAAQIENFCEFLLTETSFGRNYSEMPLQLICEVVVGYRSLD